MLFIRVSILPFPCIERAKLRDDRNADKFHISVEIRREINAARARIVDQTRSVETSSFELSKQLDLARSAADYVIPRVIAFEHVRWIVGTGMQNFSRLH